MARKKLKRAGTFYVYIVRCCDGSYYTGYSPHVRKRVATHNAGKGAKYTRARRPVKLVWWKKYAYYKNALLEELRIKKLSRKQKELLIAFRF